VREQFEAVFTYSRVWESVEVQKRKEINRILCTDEHPEILITPKPKLHSRG
jgi:hypothetical protein